MANFREFPRFSELAIFEIFRVRDFREAFRPPDLERAGEAVKVGEGLVDLLSPWIDKPEDIGLYGAPLGWKTNAIPGSLA